MHEGGFFYQAFIYLSAAVIAVPLAKKIGLGSVLGYLLAGVLIGPFVLGLIGREGQDIMHFAEFGVVMMLFLVGLELQPSILWRMRVSILGLGGVQVISTALIIMGISVIFTPLPWQTSLAIGLTLALSSTAIVLQTLNEKGLLKSKGGQNSFSVLLFQDIAVIPILAFLPLLAVNEVTTNAGHESHTLIDGLPIIAQTIVVLTVVGSLILAGKFLISPIFRVIAQTRLRELFTAASLLLVIAIALLMSQVGLSPALGTFLAGVVLAQSEYRHELETDIEPFKGLLLGLFFIAVGASIDFELIANKPDLISVLVVLLVFIKLLVLILIGRFFKMRLNNNILFAFGLAQGGEFAFVLFSYALQNGVMTSGVASPLIASVAISMALTPLLMILNEKFLQPRFGPKEIVEREVDEIHEQNRVIIAGFGRFGSTIGRFLQANGVNSTYLDIDPDNVDLLRRMGLKVFYGDASRNDLLHSAGADEAKLLIVAVENVEKRLEIVETAKKNFPHLKIISRSNSWDDSYELLERNIDKVFREFLDTSLRMGAEALSILGERHYFALRAVKKFRKHDEKFFLELSELRHMKKEFISGTKKRIEDLEKLMLEDLENVGKDKDLGWDTTTRKEEYGSK